MARLNNPRNLRSSLWSNPMFCLYCEKKERIPTWTKRIQCANSTLSFYNKIHLKKKKNKKKKASLLKLARIVVLSSSYNYTINPLLSKAATMQVQFKLNKLLAKKTRTMRGDRSKVKAALRLKSKNKRQLNVKGQLNYCPTLWEQLLGGGA